ncbi:GNAT family N-acetyltransferase [Aestuariispira insulae]|uniref:GNAT family acetyltransferase n=1 Tax=Aestuariispira insulae TaxID=1461337 RepID=A0A3D9HRS1_9PROT|nr:GNAT family N-acetyltransferase [Aestuariispira insulae]RED52213.1 GNAT family acetyltransferase [Aestuariispira insulae]
MKTEPLLSADLPAALTLFRNTIHRVNCRDYSQAQLDAWAPADLAPQDWHMAMAGKTGFKIEENGEMLGFADLSDEGLLDMFFVSCNHQGRGIGGKLMQRILDQARQQGLDAIDAHVSITAKPFFEHAGFKVIKAQDVPLRGQILRNFRMQLAPIPPSQPDSPTD